MNSCLFDLFQVREKRNRFAMGLPTAFDMVQQRMPKGNPAVGILREHVIIGFFVAEFGGDKVSIPERGNERSYDVILCGQELSVKTRTGEGGVKILWTVDTEQVEHEINEGYKPEHDILLVNIFWGLNKDSVFYIPLSAQKSVLDNMGREKYLSSATGTNNRGIEIRGRAISALKAHSDSYSFSVNWVTANINYPDPWQEWKDYWKQGEYLVG